MTLSQTKVAGPAALQRSRSGSKTSRKKKLGAVRLKDVTNTHHNERGSDDGAALDGRPELSPASKSSNPSPSAKPPRGGADCARAPPKQKKPQVHYDDDSWVWRDESDDEGAGTPSTSTPSKQSRKAEQEGQHAEGMAAAIPNFAEFEWLDNVVDAGTESVASFLERVGSEVTKAASALGEGTQQFLIEVGEQVDELVDTLIAPGTLEDEDEDDGPYAASARGGVNNASILNQIPVTDSSSKGKIAALPSSRLGQKWSPQPPCTPPRPPRSGTRTPSIAGSPARRRASDAELMKLRTEVAAMQQRLASQVAQCNTLACENDRLRSMLSSTAQQDELLTQQLQEQLQAVMHQKSALDREKLRLERDNANLQELLEITIHNAQYVSDDDDDTGSYYAGDAYAVDENVYGDDVQVAGAGAEPAEEDDAANVPVVSAA